MRPVALLLCGILATSSVAEARRSPGPRNVLDNTTLLCGLSVGAGAVIGYVAAGRDNRVVGAVIGAGVGLGVCGVIAAINTRRERARLALVESQAASSGRPSQRVYVGEDGIRRDFRATPGPPITTPLPATQLADDGTSFVGPCRSVSTQIAVSGQTQSGAVESGSAGYAQVYCFTSGGSMRPLPG